MERSNTQIPGSRVGRFGTRLAESAITTVVVGLFATTLAQGIAPPRSQATVPEPETLEEFRVVQRPSVLANDLSIVALESNHRWIGGADEPDGSIAPTHLPLYPPNFFSTLPEEITVAATPTKRPGPSQVENYTPNRGAD
jgi:hypothetical protein